MTTTRYGCQEMTAPLRRVLVRPPREGDAALHQAYGWRAAPDPARLAEEHEAFCAELSAAGAEVILAREPMAPDPDAIYAYDPALVTDRGAILLRPGKEARQCEVEPMAADLSRAGVPIAARLSAPATAEGGDTLWLDRQTLLV